MTALRLVATGDVVPTRRLGPDAQLPDAVRAAFAQLRTADIAFGTLEAALTDRGEPCDKVVMYRAPPAVAADVAAMGFDIVSLANNQTLNYGLEGLSQTIAVLDAHGVRHVGAGAHASQAWAPEILTVGSSRVGFVAFTCVAPAGWAATEERGGLAALRVRTAYEIDARWEQEEPGIAPRVRTWIEDEELARVRSAVEQAALRADVVVVSVHWGVGATAERADYQEQLAAVLVDAGASCVLGGHPPRLQGVEVRDGVLVSYSQGTFIRQQPRRSDDPALARLYESMPRSGCLIRVDVGADGGLRADLVPTVLAESDISGIAAGTDAAAVIEEIMRRSSLEGAAAVVHESTVELFLR